MSGSVIEELLRLYLYKESITSSSNRFEDCIKICEENGLLKMGISKLSHSVRFFRNYVHLEREEEASFTISKPTAVGAVSSIFTIVNDFK